MSGAVQPLLGYGSVRHPAFFNGMAFGSSGYVASGILVSPSTRKAVIRHSVSANGLALASDIPIALDSFGIFASYFGGGLYVVGDSVGGVASSSNGTSWSIGALNSGGGALVSMTYDDVHNHIIGSVGGGVVNVIPAAGALNFAFNAVATGGLGGAFAALGYRPGSGVVLGGVSGGPNTSSIYKSTDGGVTFTQVANNIFGSTSGGIDQLIYVAGQWLAFGADNGTVHTVQSISTNDGTTWSAPVILPFPATAASGGCQAGVNGLTLLAFNGDSPSKYIISTDGGNTWTFTGTFPSSNDGLQLGGVIWDGALWAVNVLSPDDSNSFFVTSPDGLAWTPGPNVVD